MLDRLKNKYGIVAEPHFNQQAVEELLGHEISSTLLPKILRSLKSLPKKQTRKRKSSRRSGMSEFLDNESILYGLVEILLN